MSDVVRIDTDRLLYIARCVREVASSLKKDSVGGVDLSGSPKVLEAYSDFLDDWKRSRKSRIKALEALDKHISAIVNSFTETDSRLANEIENTSGNSC